MVKKKLQIENAAFQIFNKTILKNASLSKVTIFFTGFKIDMNIFRYNEYGTVMVNSLD